MSKSYGKVGWDDSGRSQKKSKFLSLKNGANRVRVVSDVFKYLIHEKKFDGDENKYPRKLKCALDNCPLCKEGLEVKSKYIAAVLSADNEIKLLDMGPLLYNKIRGIKEHMKGYDDPKDYFLNIIKDPRGGSTGFYQAFPAEKVPLTAEEMALIEKDYDEEELETFCTPPTPKELAEQIVKTTNWINKRSAEVGEEPVKNSVVKDDDYEFNVKRS